MHSYSIYRLAVSMTTILVALSCVDTTAAGAFIQDEFQPIEDLKDPKHGDSYQVLKNPNGDLKIKGPGFNQDAEADRREEPGLGKCTFWYAENEKGGFRYIYKCVNGEHTSYWFQDDGDPADASDDKFRRLVPAA